MRAYQRFLNYVKFDTASDHDSMTYPSTEKQLELSRYLENELKELGLSEVRIVRGGYVIGALPATEGCEDKPVIGLIAHIDTSPDVSGKDVKTRIVENYDGGDVELGHGYTLRPAEFPELLGYKGHSLIVTDGSTLLGADDKAGIAEIVAACEELIKTGKPHGKVMVAFTTDEEVGRGVDCFDVKDFGADYAFTLDGGDLEYYSCETFNAAAMVVTVKGKNIHPGSAKNKMINASTVAMEFDSLLPQKERPQFTEGREGFFHLGSMTGCEEEAKLQYIIRDHDRAIFENRKEIAAKAAEKLNEKYGEGTVTANITDSYYNMYEVLRNHPEIEKRVVAAMKSAGIANPKPEPVRGGTDGSRLSFMGLPCPNLPTGGYNYHGRMEYILVESMDKAVEIILAVVDPYLNIE